MIFIKAYPGIGLILPDVHPACANPSGALRCRPDTGIRFNKLALLLIMMIANDIDRPVPTVDTRALLQRFPHLERIVTTWGTRTCRDFLTHLMTDTRDGRRQGFPPEHAWTIFKLLAEHDEKFPQFEPREQATWEARR